LSYTDQSGYFLPGLFKSIGKAFANIFRAVGQMHARQSAAVSCYVVLLPSGAGRCTLDASSRCLRQLTPMIAQSDCIRGRVQCLP
jgi:hypothetical protein